MARRNNATYAILSAIEQHFLIDGHTYPLTLEFPTPARARTARQLVYRYRQRLLKKDPDAKLRHWSYRYTLSVDGNKLIIRSEDPEEIFTVQEPTAPKYDVSKHVIPKEAARKLAAKLGLED